MKKLFFIGLILSGLSAYADIFYAKDYGAVGDGINDDGPAIRTAVQAMSGKKGKHILLFEKDRNYYVHNFNGIYLFDLSSFSDITIDGKGSVFLLDGAVRFMSIKGSKNIKVCNLSVDYKPLPFADGSVIARNEQERYIDVKIKETFTMPPLGGPTGLPEEQAYFGMIWRQGPHSLLGNHYWVRDIRESYPGSSKERILRIETTADFHEWDLVQVDSTPISVPVRGIAHIGPNEVVCILESENVYFGNVNIWSAPWFAIGVSRNRGEVQFRKVNICPRPGTGRLTSSWRDGFHVAANYASMLWEDCLVEGTNDDAFNIKSFASSVVSVKSDTKITIKQNFPLGIVPYNSGDIIMVYDVINGKKLGNARVVHSEGFKQTGKPFAPEITLELDKPVPGLNKSCQVWNMSSANPNTILRGCEILSSCRFQSSLTIDNCDIKALSWFYGDNTEGPIPSGVLIKNSRLFLGRGNEDIAVVFSTNLTYQGVPYPSREPVISNLKMKNNIIDGVLQIEHADKVSLFKNTFSGHRSKLIIGNSSNIRLDNNVIDGKKMSIDQVEFLDDASKKSAFEKKW